MRFVSFIHNGDSGIGVESDGAIKGCTRLHAAFPGSIDQLIQTEQLTTALGERLAKLDQFDPEQVSFCPPLASPGKIICVGLNYVDHSKEAGFKPPTYPTIFCRFASSLVGHKQPIIKPRVSEQLDFEGEMAVIIGRGGRHIKANDALKHVIGYSVFNDASLRDYQTKSPQWTMGKNFDGTGAFGPALVTSDELPLGCDGLTLETRLNNEVMQSANTSDMIFNVEHLIVTLSEVLTLTPGDVIVTGTPAGIGWARKPPVFMQAGDVCQVSIENIGTLINAIAAE